MVERRRLALNSISRPADRYVSCKVSKFDMADLQCTGNFPECPLYYPEQEVANPFLYLMKIALEASKFVSSYKAFGASNGLELLLCVIGMSTCSGCLGTWQGLCPHWDLKEWTFLRKLLKYNPAERISAKAALDHPYFDSLDKSQF